MVQADFPKEVQDSLWLTTVKEMLQICVFIVFFSYRFRLSALQQHMPDSEPALATSAFWIFFTCQQVSVGECCVANF